MTLARERHAQALAARFGGVLDAAPDAMIVADRDGQIQVVNSETERLFGYRREELVGQPVDVLLPALVAGADPRANDIDARERQLAGTDLGLQGRRKDGTAFPVEISLSHLETEEGSLVVRAIRDLTDRRRLEAALRQAQKMEAVGQLAGGVAHDFNNMLTAILGYSELLTEQIGPDKPMGQDLREIVAAAQRAATLTQQLLAFSRKQAFTLAALDLSRIVRGLEAMLRRVIGEQVAVTTVLVDDLSPVMADATQLEHVLINLAVNARDAMPQGGVLTIETSNVELDQAYTVTHPGSTAGTYAMVSVRDTGVGMTSEIQAKIFEPFFTTKEVGRGTGLGLAAVYGVVKQLGGYIAVESELGQGTTFEVYLPKTGQVAQTPTAAVSAAASQVGTETIMLVEDEDGVRAFIKIVLQRFGYRVVEAESAEAALSLLAGMPPIDLLLTDVVLPGMDGCELAVRVARARPQVRVLYMSGYTGRLRTAQGFDVPGAHLLEKPFTAEVLLTRVHQLLAQRPLGAADPEPQ